MAVQLVQNALVDLQSVKDELGFTDTANDGLLTRRINIATANISSYCQRDFYLRPFSQYVAVPVMDPPRVVLDARPLALIVSATEFTDATPQLVDPSYYGIEKSRAGIVYRSSRWKRTTIRRPDIVQDPEPGSERANLLFTGVGGWVTLPQAMAAPAWPGAGATVAAGLLTAIGTAPTQQLWLCTTGGVLGGSQPAGLASGGAQATVGQQGITGGAQVTDGTAVWTYLGTVGAAGSPGTTFSIGGAGWGLPQDLEQAALETVLMLWARRGENLEVKSESVGRASVSYAERSGIPPSVIATLESYRKRAAG